jgi:hypothetical protein
MRDKKVWLGIATAILMPGSLILCAVLGALIALVMGAIIYGALVYHGGKFLWALATRAAQKVFGKASHANSSGASGSSRALRADGVRGSEATTDGALYRPREVFDGRSNAKGGWQN